MFAMLRQRHPTNQSCLREAEKNPAPAHSIPCASSSAPEDHVRRQRDDDIVSSLAGEGSAYEIVSPSLIDPLVSYSADSSCRSLTRVRLCLSIPLRDMTHMIRLELSTR